MIRLEKKSKKSQGQRNTIRFLIAIRFFDAVVSYNPFAEKSGRVQNCTLYTVISIYSYCLPLPIM